MNEASKEFDPIHLYIRTDEKYEEVRAQMHDLQIEQKDQRNNLDRVEKRVDFGVAVTGGKNAEELSKQAIVLGTLKQTVDGMNGQINHEESGIFKQIKELKELVSNLYRGILTIFFSTVIAGIIIYAIKFFHFG